MRDLPVFFFFFMRDDPFFHSKLHLPTRWIRNSCVTSQSHHDGRPPPCSVYHWVIDGEGFLDKLCFCRPTTTNNPRTAIEQFVPHMHMVIFIFVVIYFWKWLHFRRCYVAKPTRMFTTKYSHSRKICVSFPSWLIPLSCAVFPIVHLLSAFGDRKRLELCSNCVGF